MHVVIQRHAGIVAAAQSRSERTGWRHVERPESVGSLADPETSAAPTAMKQCANGPVALMVVVLGDRVAAPADCCSAVRQR
jgi:hypothetical protein